MANSSTDPVHSSHQGGWGAEPGAPADLFRVECGIDVRCVDRILSDRILSDRILSDRILSHRITAAEVAETYWADEWWCPAD